MKVYFGISDIPEALFYSYVCWIWFRWARSDGKYNYGWRSVVALIGFAIATVSSTLSAFIWVHATFTGGYSISPPNPIEVFCIDAGSLTAIVALVAAVVAKGKLRIPTVIASVVNLGMWFLDAMSF